MKPRLSFITHSFHAKTRSNIFLQELLEARYRVTTIWDDSWQLGSTQVTAAQINNTKPDAVLFFQRLPNRRTLRGLYCKNLLWAPMRDDVSLLPAAHQKLRDAGLKLINFSFEVHRFFEAQGFTCHYLQYQPPPHALSSEKEADAPSLFFWQRRARPGWKELKKLLGNFRPSSILLRVAADPGEILPSPSEHDRQAYRIQQLDGWLEKQQYETLLASSGLFFAPRLSEGIGLAMLEAMGRGQAVIAADAATMNEYITHGINGYLYNPDSPMALDFSQLPAVRQQALIDASDRHQRWLDSIPALLNFVVAPPPRQSLTWSLRGRLEQLL